MIPLFTFNAHTCSKEEIFVDGYSQVTKCIEGRHWQQFLQLVASGCVDVANTNTDLLHDLCAHRPPIHIVEHILAKNPSSVFKRDGLLRTPLHVAVERGASSGVVRLLLSAGPSAAEAKDSFGRTPLILACERLGGGGVEFASEEREALRLRRLTKAVMLMTQASPQSSIVEDVDETSALEHAILSDAPPEIVKELQKVTAKAAKQVDTQRRRHTVGFAPSASFHCSNKSSTCAPKIRQRRQSTGSATFFQEMRQFSARKNSFMRTIGKK